MPNIHVFTLSVTGTLSAHCVAKIRKELFMNKAKKPKTRDSKATVAPGRKKTRSKFWLCAAGLLLILFIAFTALRPGTPFNMAPTDSLNGAKQYVRRETKSTLSSALFVGKTASAYRLAEEIPDVLDHLYCYCHCDKSIGHITLLSCFTDTHAANCAVCQDEAIDAAAMLRKGHSVPDIRRSIDSKYGRI
jgi:uncharacterized protein with PCYCGC motif